MIKNIAKQTTKNYPQMANVKKFHKMDYFEVVIKTNLKFTLTLTVTVT